SVRSRRSRTNRGAGEAGERDDCADHREGPHAPAPASAVADAERGTAHAGARRARHLRRVAAGKAETLGGGPFVSSLRHKVGHGGIALVRGLVRVLPAPVVRAMGAGLGLTFYAVDRVHRNVALTNLATAFPQRTLAERRQICRAMFVHFGRLLFELLRFSTLSPESMRHLIEFEGEERARAAYAQGKGVLFFTGHFGYWEVHAIGHGMALQPIGVLARALDNPMLNELLEQVRGKTGNFLIYRQGAVRKVLRTLAAGQGVALL